VAPKDGHRSASLESEQGAYLGEGLPSESRRDGRADGLLGRISEQAGLHRLVDLLWREAVAIGDCAERLPGPLYGKAGLSEGL